MQREDDASFKVGSFDEDEKEGACDCICGIPSGFEGGGKKEIGRKCDDIVELLNGIGNRDWQREGCINVCGRSATFET